MKSKLVALFAFVCLLIVPGPIFAHHGGAAYDETKLVTVRGIVTAFEWTNPHIRILWDVKDDQGNVENWQAEWGPPTVMARRGWNKNLIKAGDEITVVGHRAKNGSTSMVPQKIILSTGEELKMGGG